MMADFPAHMIDTPCVVLGALELPAGVYDKDGNCVIKVPHRLTRPDGITWLPIKPGNPGQVAVMQPDGTVKWEDR